MKHLPIFLSKYFWEVDFASLDAEKYPKYVIERILEYGDIKAIRWMKKNFSLDEIKNVLYNTRGLTLRSATFWAIVLGIPKKSIKCLSKPYLEIRKLFWPY
ncbi:hypothetical protein ISS37_00275 [candidate division KSB1 bacterium]|nr:hypothetical protein [candidate division KSB1 bacterium]